MKNIIATANAPKAIGPYSQAVNTGNLISVSGQLPLDPQTMSFVEGGIKKQTRLLQMPVPPTMQLALI